MKKYLLLALLVTITIQCTKHIEPLIIELDVHLYVHDTSGNNLLNPTLSNTLNTPNIRIYYLQDGLRKEFFNPNLDAVRNYLINSNAGNDENLMTLFPYEGKVDHEETITIIHWSDSAKEDTVRSLVSRPGRSMIITKVWFNYTLKYDVAVNRNITFGNATFDRFIDITR